jgi:hypothetical protein
MCSEVELIAYALQEHALHAPLVQETARWRNCSDLLDWHRLQQRRGARKFLNLHSHGRAVFMGQCAAPYLSRCVL